MNGRERPGPCRPLDDSATFPSNDDSSDDDDDDEDEEEYPMEESLVNLVGNTIKELAPAAQVLCRKEIMASKSWVEWASSAWRIFKRWWMAAFRWHLPRWWFAAFPPTPLVPHAVWSHRRARSHV